MLVINFIFYFSFFLFFSSRYEVERAKATQRETSVLTDNKYFGKELNKNDWSVNKWWSLCWIFNKQLFYFVIFPFSQFLLWMIDGINSPIYPPLSLSAKYNFILNVLKKLFWDHFFLQMKIKRTTFLGRKRGSLMKSKWPKMNWKFFMKRNIKQNVYGQLSRKSWRWPGAKLSS